MALRLLHCSDIIMSARASQITGVSMVYSTICSDADQRKHKRFASLAFVRGIHRWPVNSTHKGPVTRNFFPFDDVIMKNQWYATFPFLFHWAKLHIICFWFIQYKLLRNYALGAGAYVLLWCSTGWCLPIWYDFPSTSEATSTKMVNYIVWLPERR